MVVSFTKESAMLRRWLDVNEAPVGRTDDVRQERRVVETWSDRAVSVAAWLAVAASFLSVTALPWTAA